MARQDPSLVQKIRRMRQEGHEQIIPDTERVVRIRTVEAKELLKLGKMPDVLTPLVVRSVYDELPYAAIREFFEMKSQDLAQAAQMLESIDLVCGLSIVDGTEIEDLTMSEKRWIFRLAMGPAETLVNFRYEPDVDVGLVDEVEELQPVA